MTKKQATVVKEEEKKEEAIPAVVEDKPPVVSLRAKLYVGKKPQPVFNLASQPKKSASPLILDFTEDVADSADTIALMQEADIIIADSEQLRLRLIDLTDSKVVSARYGQLDVQDKDNPELVIGVLNYGTFTQNVELPQGKNVLVCGQPVAGTEYEVVNDFNEFARRIDVLVCPVGDIGHHSPTVILSIMSAGTVVITELKGSFAPFSNCRGVLLYNHNTLGKTIDSLRDKKVLDSRKKDAVAYAAMESRQGQRIIQSVYDRLERNKKT